jgi:hypothetical protein
VSWREETRSRVKTVEERVESVVPRTYAARSKVFLDRLMPFALILLGSLLTVNYLVPVTETASKYISYANWALISYFGIRLAAAFRLAESDREFLRQHWFDALLVIPAFTLVKEVKGAKLLEEAAVENQTVKTSITNLPIAAQLSRIIRIIKRSLSF